MFRPDPKYYQLDVAITQACHAYRTSSGYARKYIKGHIMNIEYLFKKHCDDEDNLLIGLNKSDSTEIDDRESPIKKIRH